MPINFPDSPTLNQQFTANGRTWRWDGSTWVNVGSDIVVADITDLTASAVEINVLDGITASTAELNYTDGVTSAIQTQLDSKTPLTQPIEAKTGAYTLQAIDKGDLVTCSGTFTITVPGNVFASGDRVDIININTGVITFSGSSLTLNSVDSKVTINKRWAGATIFFTSPTTAVLIGNLA